VRRILRLAALSYESLDAFRGHIPGWTPYILRAELRWVLAPAPSGDAAVFSGGLEHFCSQISAAAKINPGSAEDPGLWTPHKENMISVIPTPTGRSLNGHHRFGSHLESKPPRRHDAGRLLAESGPRTTGLP